ncbi:hypothetical protein SDC9_62138 [bioreactor metagenome]|uniref:Uncharacterized protein n=1 Tax=bioreactor metagenome TaxID=1076179 RepID=A0A644XHT1_9ZZZZ
MRVARNASFGVIFLDRNLDIQVEIPADIGNAKPALTKHLADEVGARQNAAAFQLVRFVGNRGIIAAARGANALGFVKLRKAAHACFFRFQH